MSMVAITAFKNRLGNLNNSTMGILFALNTANPGSILCIPYSPISQPEIIPETVI